MSLIFAIIIYKSIRDGIKLIKKSKEGTVVSAILIAILVMFCGGMLAEDIYFQAPCNLYFWLTVFLMKCIYEMNKDTIRCKK